MAAHAEILIKLEDIAQFRDALDAMEEVATADKRLSEAEWNQWCERWVPWLQEFGRLEGMVVNAD